MHVSSKRGGAAPSQMTLSANCVFEGEGSADEDWNVECDATNEQRCPQKDVLGIALLVKISCYNISKFVFTLGDCER